MNINDLKKRAGIAINENYGLNFFGVDNVDDIPDTEIFHNLMRELHEDVELVYGVALDDDVLILVTSDSIDFIDLSTKTTDRSIPLGRVMS